MEITEKIAEKISNVANIDKKKVMGLIEKPPDPKFGDYAFPCFILIKRFKKKPNEIAKDLAAKLEKTQDFEKVVNNGPYINFFIKVEIVAKELLEDRGFNRCRKLIMVEFFHANTHKGVHIGHIRNICLGESVCRLLEATGNEVVRVNFQGDIGPHVAKCIWGYLNLEEKEPCEHKGAWLGRVYALANEKSKNNNKIESEIKEINKKLYEHEKKIEEVWKKTRQYCLDDFLSLYKEFSVKFDRLYFESETESVGKRVVMDLKKRGIAKKSDGAIIVDLKKYGLGVYVVLTKDGHALYSTKDLGLGKLKLKEYPNISKSIHVVGSEQEMHFKQLFKTFCLAKSKLGNISYHLSYGLVMLPCGKMSSREGTMVLYEELKTKLYMRAREEIKKRWPSLDDKEVEKRVEVIAVGALKFSMLNKDNNRNIVFDYKKVLDFEGETGPYIQYTYARICSIIKKSKLCVDGLNVDFSLLKEEKQIILMLNKYREIIKKASNHLKPSILCKYAINLCQEFNEYYHKHNIIKQKKEIKKARVWLCSKLKKKIKNILELLNINTLEEM